MNTKEQPQALWALTVEKVLAFFDTNTNGLTEAQALSRQKRYGLNRFSVRKSASPLKIFLRQFASPLLFVLLGAGALTIALGHWLDASVVIFAVIVNVVLGFRREYKAEHTLERLMTYIKDRARVVRDGISGEVDATLLVPGDIIELSYGARIPADARLIAVNSLRVDEAVLTGESMSVQKEDGVLSPGIAVAERKNMVFAGTLVVEGYGLAVVLATGNATEIGKIASAVSLTKRAPTPIEKSLSQISWVVAAAVIGIVIIIFFAGIFHGYEFVEMLVLSAAIAVGAVPEALPIALTVILAAGAERIAKHKSVVRTLSAAETLGSVTMIMTDKTGTLTLSDMRLVDVVAFETVLAGKAPGKKELHALSESQKDLLSLAVQASGVSVSNLTDPESAWRFTGRALEVGVIKAARDHGLLEKEQFMQRRLPLLPFNSSNKFSVWETSDQLVLMGAPDVLLARATLSKENFLAAESFIHAASSDGMRLVGVATLSRAHVKGGSFAVSNAQGLSFAGILTFRDPVRESVPQAIKKIEAYGIRVVIVTGDLKGTAISVASELGWNVSEGEVISGEALRALSDGELKAMLPQIKIFARVTPEDKMRIGLLFKSLGQVVAMTGDGVNDAPSLKAMDIGVALGSGSDVAKSAADIVLLDDNFETIVAAVQEGRRILGNIRKTFVYLFSNCLDEVVLIGGSLLLGVAAPITALQIIWVNLFTGSLPALAFAYDDDHDREHAGIRSIGTLINSEVRALTFGIGILSSLGLFALYLFLLWEGVDHAVARTVIFLCFASYILVVAFSFRSLRRPLFSYPVFSNKTLNWGVIVAALIIALTISIPELRRIFSLVPLHGLWWVVIALWLVLNIVLVETTKRIFRKRK